MGLSLTHADLPYPIRSARFSALVEWRTTDGTLTNPTSPDTEYSTDGGATFADCALEVAPTDGHGYITLTGDELANAAVKVQSKGTGVLTATLDLYPRDLPVYVTGTAQAGAASTITLASTASATDDEYNGMLVRTTGGTGGGAGSGDYSNQARVVIDYVGATKVATISGTWQTNPSSDTTYDLLVTPEWAQAQGARILTAIPSTTAGNAGGIAIMSAALQVTANVSGITSSAMDTVLATTVDMTGSTDKTVQDVFRAAWAQAAGKWALVGTTLTLYAPDGTTPLHTFTVDSATDPTSRTPA